MQRLHENDTTFQFLMVRLKAGQYGAWSPYKWISIPYGAIKSQSLAFKTISANEFQFLMVRLKDNKKGKTYAQFQIFQFLMVRLKGV